MFAANSLVRLWRWFDFNPVHPRFATEADVTPDTVSTVNVPIGDWTPEWWSLSRLALGFSLWLLERGLEGCRALRFGVAEPGYNSITLLHAVPNVY
jgi:hypothetical protein